MKLSQALFVETKSSTLELPETTLPTALWNVVCGIRRISCAPKACKPMRLSRKARLSEQHRLRISQMRCYTKADRAKQKQFTSGR